MHEADYEAMKERRDSHKSEYRFYRGRIRHERWVRTAVPRALIGFVLTAALLVTLGMTIGSDGDAERIFAIAVWAVFMAGLSTFTLIFREGS